MNRLARACGLVLVAGVAVAVSGCVPSENVGKLEGTKWASAYIPEFKGVRHATATVQFTPDGRFTMELRVPQGAVRFAGTWRAGPGRVVHFENVTPPIDGESSFIEHVTIQGDAMVMEEKNLKMVFTRVDETADAPKRSAGAEQTPDRQVRK